jgi:hypothetical protein
MCARETTTSSATTAPVPSSQGRCFHMDPAHRPQARSDTRLTPATHRAADTRRMVTTTEDVVSIPSNMRAAHKMAKSA